MYSVEEGRERVAMNETFKYITSMDTVQEDSVFKIKKRLKTYKQEQKGTNLTYTFFFCSHSSMFMNYFLRIGGKGL